MLQTSDEATLTMLYVESRQLAATTPAFNLPHLHLAPPLGVTRLSFATIFSTRTLESLGYRVALFL